MWARDGFNTFKMVFSGKEDASNWCDIDRSHLEGEEKIQWEAAVEMATKLAELGSDEEVLKEVTKLGLTGGGEEIKDGGMMEMRCWCTGLERMKPIGWCRCGRKILDSSSGVSTEAYTPGERFLILFLLRRWLGSPTGP